ncbi:MAG: 30S ribosomal protein S6 [delta proteobacterium ML8_F1]|nr:MAG: 30S ribosomal protein S6 [delta proteobacterium ML8_F1]
MTNYETMYILRPSVEEEDRNAIVEKFKGIVSNGGEVVSVDEWGSRKLAYEIEKVKDGYYVLMTFKGDGAIVTELERNYRISDDVMRFIVINLDQK